MTKRKTISEDMPPQLQKQPTRQQDPKKDLDKSRSQSNLIDEQQTTIMNQNMDTIPSDNEGLHKFDKQQKTMREQKEN